MEKLQDFIKLYFRLLNVKNMPEAVLARYKKYIKDNDFPNKEVKSWASELMSGGQWKDLPDFSTLSDNEIDLLFKSLLQTFDNMNNHKRSLSKDSQDFLNTYFGKNNIFSMPEIPAAEKSNIIALLNLVNNDEVPAYFSWDEQPIIQEVLAGNKDVNNSTVKRAVFSVINQIKQAQLQGNLSPEAQSKLAPLDLNRIQNIVNQDIQVSPADRNNLRNSGAKIFEAFYKKNKLFDDFKKYEPGEKIISDQIDAALSNTDYTGKINANNYVPGKYDDDLDLRQKIDQALEETFSDVLQKYVTLHRANIFIKPEAKAIFKALDDKKINVKPTDGIGKILEKAGDITNKIKGKQPFEAANHFKWMVDKLTDYQKNGMGKAIEGALRNGHQMNHIIEQLVIDAVKEGKVKEAKTAMEVLSVMQYGLFTSRTMNAINQTDMTILSDGKLSWNKNEGIQLVTKVADRTLKTGIQLAGYGATAVANSIRRMGATFNHSGKLNDKAEARKSELARQKADFNYEKAMKDAAYDTEIRDNETRRRTTGITDINAEKNNLSNGRTIEATRKSDYETCLADFEQKEKIDADYKERENLKNEITNILNDAAVLKNNLQSMANPAANQYNQILADNTRKAFEEKEEEARQKIKQVQQIEAKYSGAGTSLDTEYNNIHTIVAPATKSPYDISKDNLTNAETAYNNQKNANDLLQNKINEYEEATENIKTAQDLKRKLQDAANNWDKNNKNDYMELMAYWDFLQSGNTKSLFHISTKKLQAKMDAGKMQTLLSQYTKSYAA